MDINVLGDDIAKNVFQLHGATPRTRLKFKNSPIIMQFFIRCLVFLPEKYHDRRLLSFKLFMEKPPQLR